MLSQLKHKMKAQCMTWVCLLLNMYGLKKRVSSTPMSLLLLLSANSRMRIPRVNSR